MSIFNRRSWRKVDNGFTASGILIAPRVAALERDINAMSSEVVHIIDDESDVCSALAMLLEANGLNTRCYPSGEQFFQEFDPAIPGCIIVDVCMPGMSGISLQEKLEKSNISFPVIILTGHADVSLAVEAMTRGAVGFLQKPARSHELLELVSKSIEWHRNYIDQLADSISREERYERFSDRERAVLRQVVGGEGSKNIAEIMGISQRTVDQHRAHIMQKLEVDSLAALVRFAMVTGENRPNSQMGHKRMP